MQTGRRDLPVFVGSCALGHVRILGRSENSSGCSFGQPRASRAASALSPLLKISAAPSSRRSGSPDPSNEPAYSGGISLYRLAPRGIWKRKGIHARGKVWCNMIIHVLYMWPLHFSSLLMKGIVMLDLKHILHYIFPTGIWCMYRIWPSHTYLSNTYI